MTTYTPTTVTVTDPTPESNYTVTVDMDATGRCCMTDDEGHILGEGRWDGSSMVDCAVDLGDRFYEAIDEALSEAQPEIEIRDGRLICDPAGTAPAVCDAYAHDHGVRCVWSQVGTADDGATLVVPVVQSFGRCEGCGCDLEEGDGLYCSGCDEAEADPADDGPDCTR